MTNVELERIVSDHGDFDNFLDSGAFEKLTHDQKIHAYNYFTAGEDVDTGPTMIHEIVNYDPDEHETAVEELMQRIVPTMVHGYDLPVMEDLGFSIQVCLIGEEVVGFIAHERELNHRYISLISVSEKWEQNGVMGALVDHVAIMGDPLVAKVKASNSVALDKFKKCGFIMGHEINGYYQMTRPY